MKVKFIPVTKKTIKWIPVTDIMPESGLCVLLYSKSGGVAEGAWISDKEYFIQWRWNSIKDDVTHWAELPEPPEEIK
jgi:hypothetical protein